MKIAIIPARAGSKRIPGKNIKPFCGKPMIAWSIEAAAASEVFDRILVSTDEDVIANVAISTGAQVPFRRPKELADDHTGTTEVVAHATQWMKQQGWPLTAVCCIYPTSVFVQPEDIQQGAATLEAGTWDFAFSATEYAAPIFRSFRTNANGGAEMFFPEHFKTRSQDLPQALHDAAQFYWGTPQAWLEKRLIFGPNSCPILIPRWRVQDIDNEQDWIRAELLWRMLMKNKELLAARQDF